MILCERRSRRLAQSPAIKKQSWTPPVPNVPVPSMSRNLFHAQLCVETQKWIFWSWIIMDDHGLSWIIMDYHGWSRINIRLPGATGRWRSVFGGSNSSTRNHVRSDQLLRASRRRGASNWKKSDRWPVNRFLRPSQVFHKFSNVPSFHLFRSAKLSTIWVMTWRWIYDQMTIDGHWHGFSY